MSFGIKTIKDKVSSAVHNKEGRVLMVNFAYLSILQVIGYVFPLITIPYLAHVIGVEGYGKIAFAASVVVYFQTIVDWGFAYTAVRDIAKNKENVFEVSRIFSNVMCAKFVLMLVSLSIFTIIIYTIPFFYEYRVVLWATFLLIPGYIMFPDWLFQAMEEMKYITIMNFVSKIIFTALVFIVIKKESDYFYEPLLTSLGMLLTGIWALWYAQKKFSLTFIIPDFKDVLATIKKSTNMFISLFLPNLYTNFSVTLLGVVGGETATGLYSSGKKFVDICDRFSQVMSRAFFPFLARRMDKHDVYVVISGGFSVVMGLFLFFGAEWLIHLFYTPEFYEAALVLKIMSVAPFFLFLMNTYGTNYLVLQGREDILRNIIVICSILGFILAWFAILYLSYIGVAVTVTCVWGIRGLLTCLFALKLKKTLRI